MIRLSESDFHMINCTFLPPAVEVVKSVLSVGVFVCQGSQSITSCDIAARPTDKQADKQTSGHHQTYYLPATRSIITDRQKKADNETN